MLIFTVRGFQHPAQ